MSEFRNRPNADSVFGRIAANFVAQFRTVVAQFRTTQLSRFFSGKNVKFNVDGLLKQNNV